MFRGINDVSADAKGRMGVPKRYREQLSNDAGGQLVVTIDTEERCLLLYPHQEWRVIEEKIKTLPSLNKTARRIQRLLLGHATEVSLDSNGRILLPAELREFANIDGEVVLIGQGNKFEVWGKPHWQKRRNVWLKEKSDVLPEQLQDIAF